MRCRPVGDRYSIGRPPPWRPDAGGFHDVSTAGPRGTRRRTRRSTAGWRTRRSRWSTAGSRRSAAPATCRRDIAATHEVHDLGDVSLLPGFVETHIHMHFPAAPDYREIARPEPVERSLIRATAAMRTPAAVRARRPPATPAAGGTWPSRSGPRPATASSPGRACWSSGRRSRPPPGTTGSWVARPTRPTPSSRAIREAKKAGVDAIKIMASGGGYTPTSNPRSQQYDADDPRRRRRPRRTGWGCRSWPTR